LKYKVGITLAMTAVAGFALVGPSVAGPEFKNKYDDITASKDCGDGDTIDYAGPLKMWPPNHKLQDLTFVATNGGGDVSTELAVSAEILDSVGGDGGPQHDPDFFPAAASGTDTATAVAQARSERSGKGEGRTYTVTATGVFDGIRTCELTVELLVPHDMRGGADWK